jgi:UDP-glucose 4-epimerase
MKKKLLITGASGYIGSVLAAHLIKKYSIYTLDKRDQSFFLKNVNKNIKCDLSNYDKTIGIVKKIKPEIIIHLAAQSTIDFVKKKKFYYNLDNTIATKNIVKISKILEVKKFIFASSAAVYKYKNRPLKEDDNLIPSNLYGKTKLKNEIFINTTLKESPTKFCILRFFNVCSADQKNKIGEFHSPETHLIPILINKIKNKKTINVYGNNYDTHDGTCIRDYIHVNDVVVAIEKSIKYLDKNNSDIFNLGTQKGCSVLELVNLCSKHLKINSKIKFKKKRFGDNDKLICDVSKAKKQLKWVAKYSSLNKIISDEIWWQKFLINNKIKRQYIY